MSASNPVGSAAASPLARLWVGLIPLPILALVVAAPARAMTCTVPGSHPTVQEAVSDAACTRIDLADQSYPESILVLRSLTIAGPGAGTAILAGRVRVAGAGTVVTLIDLEVRNGCQPEALSAEGGARVEGSGLRVVRSAALPCPVIVPIFSDDFEAGDTGAWSSTVP